MFAAIKRFFGIVETDLSKILNVFETAKADLEAHINLHRLAANAAHVEATVKLEASKALHIAADEASVVLRKIKALTAVE